MSEIIDHTQMNPAVLQREMASFLGGLYGEIKKMDENLIAPSGNLRHSQRDFENIAREALQPPRVNPNPPPQHHQVPVENQPFIDRRIQPPPPTAGDPSQLEFDFDNSATAKNILSKLEDLERKLNRIDKATSSILKSLEDAITNFRQE